MCTWCCAHRLSTVDLRHPSHTSAPQARILVAVTPTVYRALNETPLSSQARIEMSQSPPDRVAFRLVVQSVALVLIFRTASAGIYAVLRLEVLGKCVGVYRLDIASDGVLHLDAISRVLESNPLNTVLILPNNEWCCCRNRTRCRVRVDSGAPRLTWV